MKNIILIGMPACGKSTVGVLLAKTLAAGFVDTDLILQRQRKNTLQKLIDRYGLDRFRDFEDEALLAVTETEDVVVATGGSAIFCDRGMRYLKQNGVCVYLELPLNELQKRLSNIKTRGIACRRGESLSDIFAERSPFYEKYADVRIDCSALTAEETVDKIIKMIK